MCWTMSCGTYLLGLLQHYCLALDAGEQLAQRLRHPCGDVIGGAGHGAHRRGGTLLQGALDR